MFSHSSSPKYSYWLKITVITFIFLQSCTKVLGTVLQYSYFSVISRFPLKTVHPFRNFLAVLPPPPYTKLKLGKNSGYTRPTLFVGWGEGLDLCELENAPEMQRCPKTFVHDCSSSLCSISVLILLLVVQRQKKTIYKWTPHIISYGFSWLLF